MGSFSTSATGSFVANMEGETLPLDDPFAGLNTEQREALALAWALLTEAGAIIADPKVIFRGRLDVAEIDDSNPDEPIINLSYENELIDLERPREWRYTDEHQQQLYPGDTGLKGIAALQNRELVWGRR